MRVLWSPEAHADRLAIWDYIAADVPAAASRVDAAFSAAVSSIDEHPNLGRPGIIPGTREIFPVDHYRLVYEVTDDTIWILALVHTSRQWPGL